MVIKLVHFVAGLPLPLPLSLSLSLFASNFLLPPPFSFFRLIDIFGVERMKKGVVEVAGGQSELSFQLINLNAIPCTLIDPRPYSPSVMNFSLGFT
jgi:hypothetical protein